MADYDLNEVVSRVTAQVAKEMRGAEAAAFEVGDLRVQLADLAKVGGESAWTISYSTSSAAIGKLSDIVKGSQAAWTISYSTSSAAIEKGQAAT